MALMGRLPRACIAAGRKSPSDRKAEVNNAPFWQGNLPEGFAHLALAARGSCTLTYSPKKPQKKAPGINPARAFYIARLHCAAREVANPEAEQR